MDRLNYQISDNNMVIFDLIKLRHSNKDISANDIYNESIDDVMEESFDIINCNLVGGLSILGFYLSHSEKDFVGEFSNHIIKSKRDLLATKEFPDDQFFILTKSAHALELIKITEQSDSLISLENMKPISADLGNRYINMSFVKTLILENKVNVEDFDKQVYSNNVALLA